MKRLLMILLAALLLITLAACSGTPDDGAAQPDQDGAPVEGGEETDGEPQPTANQPVLYEGDGFTMELPAGWKANEDSDLAENVTMLVSENYPGNGNNIVVEVIGKDAAFDTYTQEDFVALYSEVFDGIDIISFSRFPDPGLPDIQVNYDLPTIQVVYDLTSQGYTFRQYQFRIDCPDSGLVLTFTESGGDFEVITTDVIQSLTVG